MFFNLQNILQNIFSQELKKVLEEAREDEACLAALETELESSEQHLAMALTESAQLRSQLQITTNSNYHEERMSDDSGVCTFLPLLRRWLCECVTLLEQIKGMEESVSDIMHICMDPPEINYLSATPMNFHASNYYVCQVSGE